MELGVNYIDTAPSYANSEKVIGRALGNDGWDYYVSTKLGGRPENFNPRDVDHLRRSLERSMELLGQNHIDILMIHEPDRPGQYDWFDDWEQVGGPVCNFLSECKEEGIIDYTGVGGTTVYEMKHIIENGDFDVLLTAFNSSLLWRESLEVTVPAAKKLGMGVISGSPLQQGWLSRKYEKRVRDHPPPWLSPSRRDQLLRLYSFVEELDMPIAELALRFVISNSQVDTILMGARSEKEVEENVKSVERGPLPRGVLNELEEIYEMVPYRPCEEPMSNALTNTHYMGPGRLR